MVKKSIAAEIGDVFSEARVAYEVRAEKAAVLAQARQKHAEVVAAAQVQFDAVKAEQMSYVSSAQAEFDNAQAELNRLQGELQNFIGRPDPRVSVK